MFRRLLAALFLIVLLCGTAFAAVATINFDPFSMNTRYLSSADQESVYSRYYDSDFFYQLRDITGASRQSQVAGPQWFATVYENYYTTMNVRNAGNNNNNNNAGGNPAQVYRRTMGGEIPDVPVSAIGDLLDGFNFVFAEEPQPYAAWHNFVDTRVYDTYPDPLESLCIVITEGRGEFNLKFANPYARHFPFWWNYNGVTADFDWSWWKNAYDWRTSVYYPTVEPIAYIYAQNEGRIYQRGENYTYTAAYTLNEDASGDQYISDLDGTTVILKISGDSYYDSDDKLVYTVEDNRVYNSSHELAYTLEYATGSDTANCVYICEPRDVYETVSFSDFDDDYTITVRPSGEWPISSTNYLETSINLNGHMPDYGSKLGYIGFRQRASFTSGYTNYREFTSIPTVIANVSNGNASTNPLLFDMTIYDDNNDVVDRVKFNWDVQSDKTQNLGTFFMIFPEGTAQVNPYRIETRITNNTGTRYELYRYDMIRRADQDSDYRDNYRRIWPSYWRYNLTPDLYGTLPDSFLLDAQSQIAPGLVTVYTSNMGGSYDVGSGYTTIDMQKDTQESFRLYEYDANTPRNLRLNYKRIAGMTSAGAPEPLDGGIGEVQGFSMQFVDVLENQENTAAEIRNIVGQYDEYHKDPAMILPASSTVGSQVFYVNSSALNSFYINKSFTEADFINPPVYYLLETPEEAEEPATQPAEPPAGGAFIAAYDPNNDHSTHSSDRVALLPVKIRLKIPRASTFLETHWQDLENASDSRELFNRFANFGAVWVRSDAARELDTNLFTAIDNKGNGFGAGDCVRAYIHDNYLYLDFIVIIADAESPKEGRTAFIDVITDDGVPYVLIGDGAVDMRWDLKFYVGANAANPTSSVISGDSSGSTLRRNSSNTTDIGSLINSPSGGCSLGFLGMAGVMILALGIKRR